MEFVTYRKYNEQELVGSLVKVLEENNIEYVVSEDRDSLDGLYGGNQMNTCYYIKIKHTDFERTDSILSALSANELDTVDPSHYLYSFSDDELLDLLSKPDEWNELDYQLARKILAERGKSIDDQMVTVLREKRIEDLAKPEARSGVWLYIGYMCALLGGFFGVLLGWHLSTFKKTLPNGQRVYAYSKEDREHGNRIVIVGIIVFALSWIIYLASNF